MPRLTFSCARRKATRTVHELKSAHIQGAHVQAHSDCQSRRNRLPDHQIRAPDGNPNRRGLFGSRSRRAPCRNGRYRHRHRAAAGGAELPGDRQDRCSLPGERRGGGASGLRLPVGARGFRRGAGQGRHRVHRAQSGGDRRHGRQDRVQEGRGARQGVDGSGPSRRHRRRKRGRQNRRRDRLPGDDQGLRRRWRQGHAHRPQQGRSGGEFHPRPLRSEIKLWRRSGVHREIHHRSAPRRNPGAGRQARQRHLSRRARMLDPAPQSESHRGSAEPAA